MKIQQTNHDNLSHIGQRNAMRMVRRDHRHEQIGLRGALLGALCVAGVFALLWLLYTAG